MTNSWLTEVEPSRFGEFLNAVWSVMRSATEDLPDAPLDGVGEYPGNPWPISYALSTETRFAAFRWYEQTANVASGPLRIEAFFLCPATAKPRAGLRLLSAAADGATLTPPAWWTEVLAMPSEPYAGHNLPGFMELAAILAANGNIATSSADSQADIADLAYELSYYRQFSSEQADENRRLAAKLRELQTRPIFRTADEPEEVAVVEEPVRDLSGLPDWVLRDGDRITVLPRALNGAKKSIYENPAAVYTALELLAGPYRDHRLGIVDKTAFNEALAASGLQMWGSVGASVAGEQGEAYFVNWKGRRRFLEMHLIKGGGRDERYCLRVYFFWCEDTKQAVVGSLPHHLSNSLS